MRENGDLSEDMQRKMVESELPISEFPNLYNFGM